MKVYKMRFILSSVVLMVIFMLSGCGGATMNKSEVITDDRLHTSLAVVSMSHDTVEIEMRFENVSNTPLRIYYIDDPIFNGFQSSFYLRSESGEKKYIGEEPHPHGYAVSQKDFHLILPHKSKSFRQKFKTKSIFTSGKANDLVWHYTNRIVKWKGSQQTLDGETKALFDGESIPYIWSGRISTSVALHAKLKPQERENNEK